MEDSEKSVVQEHLERYLGEVSNGWYDKAGPRGIYIVCFDDQPQQSITTYVTLGLSESILAMKGDRVVRQEFVVSAHASVPGTDIARFLLHSAEEIQKRERCLLRGEVFDMTYPLIEKATVTALYATNPTPFENGFSEITSVFPPVIFVLLVPITENEVSLIDERGWNWFEERLENQDPDIWDLKRIQEIN